MSKRNILTIILDSIFVVAFNILFFVNGGTSHKASVWTCYVFLHFSYLMILLTPTIEAKGKTASLSKFTTYSISFAYFLIELVFSNVVFFSEFNHPKTVISIQTILTAIYLVVLLLNVLANDSIANKKTSHDIKNDFIKTISAKTKYIESITNDVTLKNKINNLYYTIHSSPSKTSTEVAIYEEKIMNLLNLLEESTAHSDVLKSREQILEIEQLINKRNFMLKTSG